MLVVATGYLILLPTFLSRLNPLTGDEPFYVMTAISMVRDHDLDESNNYENRDYDEFYPPDPLPVGWRGWPGFPRDLPPHPAVSERDGLYTKHGLGLSILIALPYTLGERVGADLLVMLCGTLLAGQMHLLGRASGADSRLAVAIAAGLALTLPIAPYALLLFPEVPAALLLLFAVRRLAEPDNTPLQYVLTGAAVGFLPWLHQRFAPTAAVLVVIALVRWKRWVATKAVLASLALMALGGASLIAYNLWLYGQPLQNTRDHAGFNRFGGTVNGLFGLVIDAQWGLFIAAPVFLLALAATPWWLQRARRLALITAAAVTPYIVLVAAYKVWWGEWGPPARYLVPIVPFAAGPLAAWLSRVHPAWRILAAGVWAIGAALSLIGYRNPQRFYHHPDGVNNLVSRLDELLHVNVAQRLIVFQPYAVSQRNEREAAAYLVLALLILAYLVVRVLPQLRTGRKRLTSD